jgi:hypothetical protein
MKQIAAAWSPFCETSAAAVLIMTAGSLRLFWSGSARDLSKNQNHREACERQREVQRHQPHAASELALNPIHWRYHAARKPVVDVRNLLAEVEPHRTVPRSRKMYHAAGGVTMSDAFPMPQTVPMPPSAPSNYAPKRGLAAVAEAVAGDPPPYRPPPADYKAPRHQDAIREALKKLTHREMRELTAAIFDASKSDTIARADLPDVLDKFAYGD